VVTSCQNDRKVVGEELDWRKQVSQMSIYHEVSKYALRLNVHIGVVYRARSRRHFALDNPNQFANPTLRINGKSRRATVMQALGPNQGKILESDTMWKCFAQPGQE
jgi:hypothetical protein